MLTLRELQKKDINIINEWGNNSYLNLLSETFFQKKFPDINDGLTYMCVNNYDNIIKRVIIEYSKDNVLGLICLDSINYVDQSAKLYIIVEENEKRYNDIGKFAIDIVLAHTFNNLKLHRIEAFAFKDDKKLQALYEKCGFKCDGVKRQQELGKDKYEDVMVYSILDVEYKFDNIVNIIDFRLPICNVGITSKKVVIDRIISECDSAFDFPLKSRNNYNDLLNKLSLNACVLYAYRQKIMGYIAFYANRIDEAYISLIAIKPEYQSSGIGSYLIKASEMIIKEKGIFRLKLEVKKTNKNAIGFYKHFGFNIISDASDESYYMEKNL